MSASTLIIKHRSKCLRLHAMNDTSKACDGGVRRKPGRICFAGYRECVWIRRRWNIYVCFDGNRELRNSRSI